MLKRRRSLVVFILLACITVYFTICQLDRTNVLFGQDDQLEQVDEPPDQEQSLTSVEHVHLPLHSWTFYGTANEKKYGGPAIVPGDIYLDLGRNGLIPDPLIGDNDNALKWVGRADWTYETTAILPSGIANRKVVLLSIQGLDTIAIVKLNDTVIAEFTNQFHQRLIDLKPFLNGQPSITIMINFRSPVNYAAEMAQKYAAQYKHGIPPDCWPSEFRGECHINFIRKVQASFSWDWGPSFPTSGIWQPISIEAFDFAHITLVSAQVVKTGGAFAVTIEIFFYAAESDSEITVSVTVDELSLIQTTPHMPIENTLNNVTIHLAVSSKTVELWWPNGHGRQKLYPFTVGLKNEEGQELTYKGKKLGFRSIDLVQDPIDPKSPGKGRYFYFKVNDVPIFLKGSNWIPMTAFPGRADNGRIEFLLASMAEANMNALRVWGGGRYESDFFYETADRLGILIWHDLMFACNLYPTDPQFLESVQLEIETQVNRIKHFTSVLVWAGNNENEFAIASNWWHQANFGHSDMIRDYRLLYMEKMKPLIEKLDRSRPFLLSSPTNGIESEKSGSVHNSPNSDLYGDIHFYSDTTNLWDDGAWRTPRCASEYGVQSMPMKRTLTRAIPNTTLNYDMSLLSHRQHKPGGSSTLPRIVGAHFVNRLCGAGDQAKNCQKSPDFLDRFIYESQMHQALAYQSQTEHYIRWRSQLSPDGYGWTMCALYWQLNDIWAAPTWSSIDFDLNWKASHYMARRFFAPILISSYVDGSGELHIYVVSDRSAELREQLTYEVFNCTRKCDRIGELIQFNVVVAPYTSVEIVNGKAIRSAIRTNEPLVFKKLVDRTRLVDQNQHDVTFENIRVGHDLIKADPSGYGTVSITSVTGSDNGYQIVVNANGFAPLIWLDLKESIPGWFSDNAFSMMDGERTITFTTFSSLDRALTAADFTVCSLSDCGKKPD